MFGARTVHAGDPVQIPGALHTLYAVAPETLFQARLAPRVYGDVVRTFSATVRPVGACPNADRLKAKRVRRCFIAEESQADRLAFLILAPLGRDRLSEDNARKLRPSFEDAQLFVGELAANRLKLRKRRVRREQPNNLGRDALRNHTPKQFFASLLRNEG